MRNALVVPIVGLATLAACTGSADHVTVAAGARTDATATTKAPETTTTTAPPETTTTTTAKATPTSSSTSTTRPAPPVITTTRRPTPTTITTRPTAKTFIVTYARNQYGGTEVTAKGGGCSGPEYGVSLTIKDPSGQPFDGTGGLAYPDGTWELHKGVASSWAHGRYTFVAQCVAGNGPAVFSYDPQTLDWAG